MSNQETSMPPVLLGASELESAKRAVQEAIAHVKGAMGAGLTGAGGTHTAEALTKLEAALRDVESAIGFHRGSS